MSKRLPPSQRPERKPEPDIYIASATAYKSKQGILLTEPQFKDLTPYGNQILAALEQGYKDGLENPAAFVIWRGSAYAKEHGLDRSDDALIFSAISGAEAERLAGLPDKDVLPTYGVVLAVKDGFQGNVAIDLSPDGMILAWRYSPRFRHDIVANNGMTEEGFLAIEKITGIGRDD